MKVLVIGGTKFFGKAIVRQLQNAGHKVSIFSRGNQRPEFLDQVEHIAGDRTNFSEFKSKLQQRTFDIVMDNIAFNANEVQSALDTFAGNVKRYVFTSTGSLYGTMTARKPIREEDVNFKFQPPEKERDQFVWTYTMGKLQAEKALLDQDKVEFTIIRPPMVLGPEDVSLRGYFYFQRLLDKKPLILTNGGFQSFRMAYSEDLAKGYLLAMKSKKAIGQTYNIAQQEVITLRELLEEAAKVFGVETNFVDIPYKTMSESGFQYPEPYSVLQNFIPDVSKAERDLNYTSTTFSDWIAKTALWHRDVYRGKDSGNYENRTKEVEFAERFQQTVSSLKTKS